MLPSLVVVALAAARTWSDDDDACVGPTWPDSEGLDDTGRTDVDDTGGDDTGRADTVVVATGSTSQPPPAPDWMARVEATEDGGYRERPAG